MVRGPPLDAARSARVRTQLVAPLACRMSAPLTPGRAGTLVESVLDFAEMYRRGASPRLAPPQRCADARPLRPVGVDRSQDILAVIAGWDAPRRAAAQAAIAEVEAEALASMRLTAGAAALGAWCAARGIKMGLVTRNTASSVVHLHTHHWAPPLEPLWPAVARDDGLLLRQGVNGVS